MQKLGQHFLKNSAILERIVAALKLERGDQIVEIGPGHGELTLPLVRAAEKIDCMITSIEKDQALIPGLILLGKKEARDRLTIIEGDALRMLPETIQSLTPRAAYTIVGNIPYYITGKLLRVISELEHKPERVVLMIQKEVAERICAEPPAMNRLAASVQFWADATIVAVVPRKDFSPPPEVDSAVIVLEVKKSVWATPIDAGTASSPIDAKLYYKTVRGIFAQPRKTLLNNIMAMGDEQKDGQSVDKKEITATRLKECGIDPGARPQDLGVPQIIAIAQAGLWG